MQSIPQPATPTRQPIAEGTQHGGGGHTLTFTSSEPQVNRAVDIAVGLMTGDSNYRDEVFTRFFEGVPPPWAPPDADNDLIRKVGRLSGSTMSLDYFAQSKIIRKRFGDCGDPAMKHADASVSKLDVGADICISIENLMRIPPDNLVRQVLSLMIHEAAHLLKLGESEATRIQSLAYNSFENHFSADKAARVRSDMGGTLTKILFKLQDAYASATKDDGLGSTIAALGHIDQLLEDLQPSLLKYDISFEPKFPYLSVFFDAARLKFLIDLHDLGFGLDSFGNWRGNIKPGTNTRKALRTAIINIGNVIENWAAYGHGFSKPVCLTISLDEKQQEKYAWLKAPIDEMNARLKDQMPACEEVTHRKDLIDRTMSGYVPEE